MLKNVTQKMLSMLMIFILMLNLFMPTVTFAEGEESEEITNNYEIKVSEEWNISEDEGGNVKANWTLDNKTLLISGEGEMKEYSPGMNRI